jgi:hypothetical protein
MFIRQQLRLLLVFAVLGCALGGNILLAIVLRPKPYALLERTLGGRSRDPKALLETLTWEYRGNGSNAYGLDHPAFFDVQHSALLRLLDLQKSRFNTSIPKSKTGGVRIDHSLVRVNSTNGSNLVILGTPTLKPVRYHRPEEGYWEMHFFEFTPEGRLVSRHACTNW